MRQVASAFGRCGRCRLAKLEALSAKRYFCSELSTLLVNSRLRKHPLLAECGAPSIHRQEPEVLHACRQGHVDLDVRTGSRVKSTQVALRCDRLAPSCHFQ